VQPGAQGKPVFNVAAFFTHELGFGDDGVDLAGAGADARGARADRARDELACAIELDRAADLAADEVVEVEVGRLTGAPVQGIGRLEQKLIFEEAVQALSS
jgi:hypothetical protein